jgi:hypothetical protein
MMVLRAPHPDATRGSEPLRILSLGEPRLLFDPNPKLSPQLLQRATHADTILAILPDGGGIRGLSSLLILEDVMEKLRAAQGRSAVPRPCQVFDLIGGTSTGG